MIRPTPTPQALMAMHLPLFEGLSVAELQEILAHSATHAYPATERVLSLGDTPGSLLLVLQGRLKIFRLTEAGHEVVLGLAGPGECLLLHAVFYPHPATVAVETDEPSWLLHIPAAYVREHWVKHPVLAANMLKIQAVQANQMMYHAGALASLPAMERVAGYLLSVMLEDKIPRQVFDLPYPKTEIASHLGLTPETFSRCLKALGAHGVQVKGRQVTLQTQDSLCAFCDPVHAHHCADSTKARCRVRFK